MTKAELRQLYLNKRAALSEAEYFTANRLLSENFFMHTDLSFIKVLHCFLPITEKKEPDTWLIIDRVRREFPHIRLSVPRVNPESERLEHFYFEGLHQLKKNKWGIHEPQQGIPTPVEKIDMVLVPLLCFDKEGHRVGYGKGYYDKFLAECPRCKTIGLSLFDAEERIEDVHTGDVTLHSVITPKSIHTF